MHYRVNHPHARRLPMHPAMHAGRCVQGMHKLSLRNATEQTTRLRINTWASDSCAANAAQTLFNMAKCGRRTSH